MPHTVPAGIGRIGRPFCVGAARRGPGVCTCAHWPPTVGEKGAGIGDRESGVRSQEPGAWTVSAASGVPKRTDWGPPAPLSFET